MKKIIMLITLVAFLSTACNHFLDLNPLDQLSEDTFWKTSGDFDIALVSLYGGMQADMFSTSLPCWDGITDNGFTQHQENQYGMAEAIVTGNINSSSTGFINQVYIKAYSSIARANIFLKQLDSFTGTMDAVAKAQYTAQARMFRAHYYSYLYRCYGDVPIVDTPVDLKTQFKAKSPAADVLAFIMADLDFAIANLPNVNYITSKGHWTSSAAKAYKVRMLLYDAYDASGNAISQKMTDVITLLSGISGFTLAPDFTDNFADAKQQNCPEIMMSVKFLAPNNWHSMDLWYGQWVVISPLANLISEFEFLNGSPGIPIPMKAVGSSVIDISKFNDDSLAKRDPRLVKTIRHYNTNGVSYPGGGTSPLGESMLKFASRNLTPPYSATTYSQTDIILIRYADVLLMLAEAENELNGPTAIAYKAINDIRKRAGMPNLPSGLTKEQMRAKIRHERRIELAFECSRYFDLKRWKIAKQVLNNVKDGVSTYSFLDKFYLWPIPQAEIDNGHGVLIQNPDYK
ncbi:MAG: RagB/SusD family nutrient uptake outer membrane protein [Prolixibacteraceae bacterium]|nr:RagB/SusD family nutrient uptake outer membrane protein [Prolixibacteraceae bacterium]